MSNPIIPAIPIRKLPSLTPQAMSGSDVLPIVDISDTTDGSTGTTKQVTFDNMLYSSLPADDRTVSTLGDYLGNNAVFNVRDYGAVGDNDTDDSAAFTKAIAAMPSAGGALYIPPGKNYKIANVTINKSMVIYGGGDSSIITVGAANSKIFAVTAANVELRDVQLVGDGTASSSITGIAILLSGANFRCTDVLATGFGFGVISGVANTETEGPKITRLRSINNGTTGSTDGSAAVDVYMGGAWQHAILTDCTFKTTASTTAVLFYDLSDSVWYDVQVRGGSVDGYQRYGIVVDDEGWDGSDRVFAALIDGVSVRNTVWEGIKAKVSRGIRVVNNVLDNCSQEPENSSAGLYGSILVNSLGQVLIANNLIRNSGCDAIRVEAGYTYPAWNPAGQACSQYQILGNIIETTGVTNPTLGYGISILNPMRECEIADNTIRGTTSNGILALGAAGTLLWNVGIFNNTIVDCPHTTYGIRCEYINLVRMDGNLVRNASGNGCNFEHINTVIIGSSNTVLDPTTGPVYAHRFATVADVQFAGKCGNTIYTAWAPSTAYSLSTVVRNGTGVYQCVVAGTSASSGGPSGTGEQIDGTVTWYYVGYYKGFSYGINGTSSITSLVVGDDAEFKNLVTAALTGVPSTFRHANIASGTATLASGTKAITLPLAEPDAGYRVTLAGDTAENFTWASKTTTGFTINSDNASSTANVDWAVTR